MAKIFYGNGDCEIQQNGDIIYCELRIDHPILINDKSPDGFIIKANNNKIIIAKFFQDKKIQLKEMFSYVGELNIIRAIAVYENGDKEYPIVKKVMDYTELLTTNAEDMTIISEDLRTNHVHGKRIKKTRLLNPYLENMTTENDNFYLEDGSHYSGFFHKSHTDGRYFTGATHTTESLPLYFKDIYEEDVKEGLILKSYQKSLNFLKLPKTS